ncbi:XK-related protein 6 [Trichonephila inaurata madagascariensis]|uniref:XK-related protein n=1 Tax=Trichonephila inaurata madagascariensis TaxID=2747483 RepID=A0A8X6XG62_9ARAC|nr:XK-related protein 6 [Trichonephila inaurata madagascariensis]
MDAIQKLYQLHYLQKLFFLIYYLHLQFKNIYGKEDIDELPAYLVENLCCRIQCLEFFICVLVFLVLYYARCGLISSLVAMAQEFLPLCDVLFNIISLASYFCDIVFDVVTIYTLYVTGQVAWFMLSLSCIMLSLIISQLLSLKWYYHRSNGKDLKLSIVAFIHLIQFGVLWRYFKLFLPVDLNVVKNEVRDLCMLRLIHAFCEAAPMLLIQLYLIWLKPSSLEVTDLNLVSTVLSLFSVCWALASFSKNVRRRNIHKLVLTWLGVIFQFFWRLGTVSSRVVVLTVYATLYHYWVFLVISLHWLTMFLWLISPKNVFHGESISVKKKTIYSMLIAFVYIFCYINLQEINSRQKMIAFYVTMFLENSLLMAVFLFLKGQVVWFHNISLIVAWGGFFLGIAFMILYYRFFHIQHLKHSLASQGDVESHCADCIADNCETHNIKLNALSDGDGKVNAFKRKKKKPSSFVPPPAPVSSLNNGGKTLNPFWKRLPPKSYSSDHESSVGSRVNIQQKLQEKQQQLQELKEIEEEIKQGKLKRPHPMEISDQDTLHQPIPHSKKQPWVRPESPAARLPLYHSLIGPHILNGIRPKTKQRSQTPEILLVPETLDSSMMYCDYQESRNSYLASPPHVVYPRSSDVSSNSNMSAASKTKIYPRSRNLGTVRETPSCRCPPPDVSVGVMYKSHNVPSDLDSQISLPRSYTLPREFRYYRRPKPRKPVRTEHFVPSNNSSDGDVDSADDNETYVPFPNHRVGGQIRLRPYQPYRACVAVSGQLHETKL